SSALFLSIAWNSRPFEQRSEYARYWDSLLPPWLHRYRKYQGGRDPSESGRVFRQPPFLLPLPRSQLLLFHSHKNDSAWRLESSASHHDLQLPGFFCSSVLDYTSDSGHRSPLLKTPWRYEVSEKKAPPRSTL